MHYSPDTDDFPLLFNPFKSCTVPRPIGWISTISKDGRANIAPFTTGDVITIDGRITLR